MNLRDAAFKCIKAKLMIFSVGKNNDSTELIQYLNKQHQNIIFTYEYEVDGMPSFLDSLIGTRCTMICSRVYRKSTFTGLYIVYARFVTFFYKLSWIQPLLFRAFRINSTWHGFHQDLYTITDFLQKNCYPQHHFILYLFWRQ